MTEMKPYYESQDKQFILYHNDSLNIAEKMSQKFDLVYADPPYFLSSNGLTIHNGKVVSVNKADWDKSLDYEDILQFNKEWIKSILPLMKNEATIWISGTTHNIFTILHAIKLLNLKFLNMITWQKTNPPPNFYTKIFKHTTEYILFARKSHKVTHYFNYDLMKALNNEKRMTDVWTMPSIGKWEKSCGKHPTQKPLSVLSRIILAASKEGDTILDPFTGSSTTGIAANLLNRNFIGIDNSSEYLDMSICRYEEIQDKKKRGVFSSKIPDINKMNDLSGNSLKMF